MANLGTQVSVINEIAQLAGLFNWQMTNASFTPNGSNTTVSFHVITNSVVPAEQYIAGAVNTYNLISPFFGQAGDPNTGLFNTTLSASGLDETIIRKYTLNRVPYANYDQPVDLGVGSQRILFRVIFAGTQYLNAFQNTVQSLFGSANNGDGLGTLVHPFYGTIKNCLPIRITNRYNNNSLNCVISELEFITSNITHLTSSTLSVGILSTIGKYFIGTQNAITSLGGSLSAVKAFGNNIGRAVP